jgi:CRP-like cAMP-binding protein
MLSTIEKVLLLQEVEILKSVSTEHLGYVAAITEEIEFQEGDIIYSEGESASSMYVVISGEIRLHRGEQEVMIAKPKTAIGVWALFEEEEERMVTATCLNDTKLLCLEKEDFHDLLADHSAMIRSVLSAMAKKLRGLVGRVSSPNSKNE